MNVRENEVLHRWMHLVVAVTVLLIFVPLLLPVPKMAGFLVSCLGVFLYLGAAILWHASHPPHDWQLRARAALEAYCASEGRTTECAEAHHSSCDGKKMHPWPGGDRLGSCTCTCHKGGKK